MLPPELTHITTHTHLGALQLAFPEAPLQLSQAELLLSHLKDKETEATGEKEASLLHPTVQKWQSPDPSLSRTQTPGTHTHPSVYKAPFQEPCKQGRLPGVSERAGPRPQK